MSVDSARACLRRLIDDADFMAEAGAAGHAEQRRAVVQGAGYESTLGELAGPRTLELSDEKSLRVGMADEGTDGIFVGVGCGRTHEAE